MTNSDLFRVSLINSDGFDPQHEYEEETMQTTSLRHISRIIISLAASLLMAGYGAAQSKNEFPVKPIRLVVGFSPGGGTDITARTVAQALSERDDYTVIVDNRPGAGGAISREIVRNAHPDGYTLLLLSASQTVNASLITKDAVGILDSFDPVTQLVWYPYLIVGNPSAPWKTMRELITYAKSKPGAINYGTPGYGTFGHLGSELLADMAGIKMTHVPYKGSNDSIREVMGGQIQLSFASVVSSVSLVQSGKLRALAVSSGKRAKLLPNIPTVAESGVPGYDVTGWYAAMATKGTPKNVVMKLNRDISKVLDSPKLEKIFAADGSEADATTPEKLRENINREVKVWGKLLASVNIKLR